MTRSPSVSVIIPLYNKAAYIVRAVRSALAQLPAADEVLVIDDGSTDDGLTVLEQLPEYSRIRVVRQGNAGEGAARNRGLLEMRGELAAFLDADDEWLPGHLRNILELARVYPSAGIFATGFRSIYRPEVAVETAISGDQPRLIADYFEAARSAYCIHISACAAWKSVAAEVGGFSEGEALGADLDFYARVALRHPVALHPAISGIYYAGNPGSAIHTHSWTSHRPLVVRQLRGPQAGRSQLAQSAEEYADWMLGEHALTGLCCGQRRDAVRMLGEIRSSRCTPFRSPRLVRLGAQWLPLALLRALIRLRRSRFGVANLRRAHTVVNRVVRTHA